MCRCPVCELRLTGPMSWSPLSGGARGWWRPRGFVDLQVWRSDSDPAEVVMVSRWRDKDAFREYMRSSDHRVSHDRMDPLLRRAVKLERLENTHTYEVVAESPVAGCLPASRAGVRNTTRTHRPQPVTQRCPDTNPQPRSTTSRKDQLRRIRAK